MLFFYAFAMLAVINVTVMWGFTMTSLLEAQKRGEYLSVSQARRGTYFICFMTVGGGSIMILHHLWNLDASCLDL